MPSSEDYIDEIWTRAGGLRLFSRACTRAPRHPEPRVMLIHGLSVSSRPLMPTLRALAPSYPAYALDLPGFGRSDKPERALDVAELADATVAWMEAIGVGPAVLAGHSMGCQVVVEIAHRHPARVSGAVLVTPTGDPDAHGVWRQVGRLIGDALREPPRLTALALRDYRRAGMRRSLATLRHMDAHPMAARLGTLTVPALLVVGSRDPVVPRDWATEAIERLPHGRLVVIPGGRHGLPFAMPNELAGAIGTFIEEAEIG